MLAKFILDPFTNFSCRIKGLAQACNSILVLYLSVENTQSKKLRQAWQPTPVKRSYHALVYSSAFCSKLLGPPVFIVPPVETARPVFRKRLVVWVCRCSFQQVLYNLWCGQHTESTSLVRKDVLQEVINMTRKNAYDVHYHRVAQEQGEAEQHPRKIGRLEVDQPEEVEPEVGVAPAPHVHQHCGEGVAQEQLVHKHRYQNHERSAQQEHVDKVGRPSTEGAFLEHPTVADGEEHVEEEGKAKRAKEQESGDESPCLIMLQYQCRVEVKLEWGYDVQLDSNRRKHTSGGVSPGDDGNLEIFLNEHL